MAEQARVSTGEQSPDTQCDRLTEAGALRVFIDVGSGIRFDRPGLAEFLDHARPGDRLCVTRLSRLGRSLRELLETVDGPKAQGIHFVRLRGLDMCHTMKSSRTRNACSSAPSGSACQCPNSSTRTISSTS